MQINRLFEITYILLNKKAITAKELAEHFGVSIRTIYRDIDVLSITGIPIYTEKGRSGGISLMQDFVLSKSILNEREQNEILSALQSLSKVKAAEADRVLNKLSAIFNKNTVHWMEVDFSGWGSINEKLFYDLKAAILEHRVAEFDYYSAYGEVTRRRIEPIQLWFKSRSWYVKCFCLTKNDLRLFKLSRMRNLTISDERFLSRDLENYQDWDSPVIQKFTPLKLKIDPKMTYRLYDDFCEECIEIQPDGNFVVSVEWPEDDWTYGMILSYGEYVEVLEPEHIKTIIKEKSQKIVKKYL